ncbi:MAG: hypothetical protein IKO14_00410 [Oscillibacter sp.]|nr:hypothetical protein [Oscillibacter sp.]
MNVFISWSGTRSRLAAEAFHRILPMILTTPNEKFYLSTGIYKGANWNANLNKGLQIADFGILCVTRDNYAAPWMIYEAGFLAHKAGADKVAPFLLDISPSELRGPVTQFQSTVFEKEDLRKLVFAINRLQEAPVRESYLSSNFDMAYDTLAEHLRKASDFQDEEGIEDMARKTLAGVEKLLNLSTENQSLLREIMSGLK